MLLIFRISIQRIETLEQSNNVQVSNLLIAFTELTTAHRSQIVILHSKPLCSVLAVWLLYCTVLCCTVLLSTVLYCTVLYCYSALTSSMFCPRPVVPGPGSCLFKLVTIWDPPIMGICNIQNNIWQHRQSWKFLGSSKYIKDKTFYCGKSKNILFFPFNQFKSCVDVESWHDDVGSDAGELVSCSKLSDHGSDPEKQKKRKSKIQINFHRSGPIVSGQDKIC